MFTNQQAVKRLAQIPQIPQIPHKVKAVSDLDGLGRAVADAIGKGSTLIATHFLYLGSALGAR
jgi:hypothetical protein